MRANQKESVTMQELKDNLKKEKITALEHIQSVKNCIDCVGATKERYDFLLNRHKLCDHHRLELGFDMETIQEWKNLCMIANPNGDYQDSNPYYIDRVESPKSVEETLRDLNEDRVKELEGKFDEALNSLKESGSFVLEWTGQDTGDESLIFRSSMYGTFVRASRR